MIYNIKAHETLYNGVLFRSRLEARWAAFFDIVGWEWEYEPIDIDGWTPDFRIKFPCGHSECPGHHVLLVEVKPYYSLDDFKGHPCLDYPFGEYGDKKIPADASAAFGINPDISWWQMVHGHGGGQYYVKGWHSYYNDYDSAWKKAGNLTMYKHKKEEE